MSVVASHEDSELWQTILMGKNLPDSLEILVDVIAGGVVLDDYTVARLLTAGDFSETGEYNLRLYHPNDRDGSTCFAVNFLQNGVRLGATQ